MPTTRYTPDNFEQECICLLYTWLAKNGFQNPDLPPIYLSFETPKKFEDKKDWHKIFEDEEGRDNHEWFEIDGVLGLYFSNGYSNAGTPEIVLYAQGITAVAKRLNVPSEMLRAVVLVHEIGHWISHAVPYNSKDKTWETADFDLYMNPSHLLEMWAQLFPYWVAKEIQGSFKLTFEVLNTKQLTPYRTFQLFTHLKKEVMLKVLIAFHRPVNTNDKSSEDFSTGYNGFYVAQNERKLTKRLVKRGTMTNTIRNSGIF